MSREIRASELQAGDTYDDYCDAVITARAVTQHGDRVLIVTNDGTELSEDIDTVVSLIEHKEDHT